MSRKKILFKDIHNLAVTCSADCFHVLDHASTTFHFEIEKAIQPIQTFPIASKYHKNNGHFKLCKENEPFWINNYTMLL